MKESQLLVSTLALAVFGAVSATYVSDLYQANHGPSKAYAECDQYKNAKHTGDNSVRCYEFRSQKLVALQKQFSDKSLRTWSY